MDTLNQGEVLLIAANKIAEISEVSVQYGRSLFDYKVILACRLTVLQLLCLSLFLLSKLQWIFAGTVNAEYLWLEPVQPVEKSSR